MADRAHLPTNFFTDDVYTIAPTRPTEDSSPADDRWLPHEPEGQLSVDVFETSETVVITAPIAGVKPEDLEIYISNDLVTIRGRREDAATEKAGTHLYQECYWGSFSRSIILPVHVSSESAEAVLKNGVLAITVRKVPGTGYVPVSEVYDDEL
ncbi:Hsp20/alpha crystallin family protein [Candidatus Uhrbacteria bacterium]|nr:Hsp20/alpha crystallin family protein [Candidatus Uhrbacteria bacterium]